MAINYPAAIDGTAQFAQPQGTTLVTNSLDHAATHANLSLGLIEIETLLGTTAASNGRFGAFASGDQIARLNSGGTLQQTITKGTFNNVNLGSVSAQGGTFTAPTIAGQGTNSGTISGGVYGTAQIQGGTGNNMTLGTPAITGGTANSITLGTPTINGLPWTNFIPLMTGFSGTTTQTGEYIQIGNLVIVNYGLAGTSNGTVFTTNVPVAAAFSQVSGYFGGIRARDNGTISQEAIYDYESGTTISLFRDYNNTAWTASGIKSAFFTIMYRA